ncbi:hypothetical protein CXB51_014834 [Gossypium anomalum]|uniref:Integrase catalytic domain-containing protein n=1 Tax=Gossypium anomalum TaxID=47600 RepID=A0A8J6CXU8_9ROSI|nr:hypothetical protein CXB51_014834 [Gossypium anomalum]
MATETVPNTVPMVDTPRHSSNTREAVHSQGPGSLCAPTQLENPAFLVHKKQDKFLASWLLSTVTDDVLVHLTTAKTSFDIWTTIERRFSANSFVSEQEQVSVILAGLSLEFESIRVFASATHLALDLLTEMLIDCEARQLDLLTEGSCQANLASRQQDTDVGSKQAVESNRYSQDNKYSYKGQGRGRSRGNSRGLMKTSPVLVQLPRWQSTTISSMAKVWYPDSGATNHITPDMANLTIASPYTGPSQVSMGNGDPVSISHIGSSNFMAGSRLLRLQTILHVPTVCKNLMSVGQFGQDNAVYFEFHPYLCFVKDIQTKKTLLVGHMHKGLYLFDFLCSGKGVAVPKPRSLVLYTAQSTSLPNICAACQLGKSYKLPFNPSKTLYTSPFEHAVSDVWGSAHFNSIIPSRYFKATGGEYRSLSKELSHLGILHRVTYPHTSKQNGVTKRKHRQIVEMGLTLLAQSFVPLKFWSYAFAHTAYLTNKLPTPILHHVSPYEKLYKCQPVYSRLKVFSCACFPNLRAFNQHKLQFRFERCVFLGVGVSQKGYKYLTRDGRVLVSRHVVFDKSHFPFQTGFSSYAIVDFVKVDRQRSHVPLVLHTPSAVSTSSWLIRSSPMIAPSTDLPLSTSSRLLRSPHLLTPSQASLSLETCSGSSETASGSLVPPQPTSSSRTITTEPSSISEAFQSPEWTTTAQAEYNALILNCTWDLMPLPVGRQAAGYKWIFKVKRSSNGLVARYKGRLVLALVVSLGWSLRQVDINNAFLNGDLQKDIYIVQPPGFEQQGPGVQQPDLGRLNYFLGIEVTYSSNGVFLSQQKYIQDLLQKAFMDKLNSSPTPMVSTCHLSAHEGFCVFFGGNLISWSSRKQEVVSRFTTEAEYKSLAHVTAEMIWVQSLLSKLCAPVKTKALVWCNSSAAVTVASNPACIPNLSTSSWIYFFVREKVADGSFQVGHMSSQDQDADILTKTLSIGLFSKFRSQLRVMPNNRELCPLAPQLLLEDSGSVCLAPESRPPSIIKRSIYPHQRRVSRPRIWPQLKPNESRLAPAPSSSGPNHPGSLISSAARGRVTGAWLTEARAWGSLFSFSFRENS